MLFFVCECDGDARSKVQSNTLFVVVVYWTSANLEISLYFSFIPDRLTMATHHTSSGFQTSPWVERKSDGGAPLLLVLLHVISRFLCHTCVLFHHDLAGTHENWPTKHKPKVLNG